MVIDNKIEIIVKYRNDIKSDGSQSTCIERYEVEDRLDAISIDQGGAAVIRDKGRVLAVHKDYIWAKRQDFNF